MKTNLKEPDDKLEKTNAAANGCGLIIVGGIMCIVGYALWVLFTV